MTLRFGSIIIHRPDPKSKSDAESSNVSSDDAEVAEIAETATVKYANKKQGTVRRSERQKRTLNKNRNLESKSSNSSLNSSGSNEISILRIMNTDKSPPLLRSHYTRQVSDRLQGKEVLGERNHQRNNKNAANQINGGDGERVGFRVLTSGSRTSDKSITRRRDLVVPDTTSSFTTPFVPVIDEEAAVNGISKLFRNLNFAERLRQQKAEQERLNIHTLPIHMKEQLKHIYVY